MPGRVFLKCKRCKLSKDNNVYVPFCENCFPIYYAEMEAKRPEHAGRKYRGPFRAHKKKAIEMYQSARARSVQFGWPFTISIIQLEIILINGKCQKSGISFDFEEKRFGDRFKKPFGPSLDRIDNERYYEFDNIQIVCNMYNMGKSDALEVDFIAMCMSVAERNKDNEAAILRMNRLLDARL